MKYLEKNIFFRSYSEKTDAEQVLILCSLFSLGLMFVRIIYTGSILFSFLVWNLFLAAVPFLLSQWLGTWLQKRSRWKFFLWVFIWLIFVPNSFYIITDLFHLDMNEQVPLWYDLILLLSFAWNGLLFGILSVRHMEKLFEQYFNKKF